MLDPRLQSVQRSLGDLELHRTPRLVLHDDGSCCRPTTTTKVADFQGDEVTSAKPALDARVEERQCARLVLHL